MNRKAFELSVNFLVMLIISIVIFGGALYMVKQFFSSTQEIQKKVSAEIEAEIERRLVESGEQVAIPLNKAKLGLRESYAFGLGILNMLGEEKTFSIKMNFDRAFTKFNEPITLTDGSFINKNWIFEELPPATIKNNDYEIVPLTVVADNRMSEDSTTAPGTYVFNVCVFKEAPQECRKGAVNLYPEGRISKIYVELD